MDFSGSHAFARYMLREDRLLLRPRLDLLQSDSNWSELILFQDGQWQVELVMIRPHAVIQTHRHNRVESSDLALGGSGVLSIGKSIIDRTFERKQRGRLAANLIRVPKGIWHGGSAHDQGGVFLSFQRWDGRPGFVTEDWECLPENK